MCTQRIFLREFNSQQLLFEAFFDISGNYAASNPKVNLLQQIRIITMYSDAILANSPMPAHLQ